MSCCDLETKADLRELAIVRTAPRSARQLWTAASNREATPSSCNHQEPAAIVVIAPFVGAFIWAALIFVL